GFHDPLAGHGGAAHQLDHDVDLGVAHHLHAVGGQGDLIAHQGARLVQVAHGGRHDLDAAARAAGDFISVAFQYVPGAAADHTQTQQTYLDGTHLTKPSLRNISLMPRTA